MLCGSLCLSHSPLMHHNRAPADVEAAWEAALQSGRDFIGEVGATHAVVFFPDHMNGMFYNMLPPFCVAAAGTSLGDFGTVPGPIDIPEELAADCHAYAVAHGIDAAISYNMTIDHGGAQAFEAFSGSGDLTEFVPIFVNCIAPPLPSFQRLRDLGKVIGDWARQRPEGIIMIGTGGMSHDPPLPNLKTATGAAAERLRNGGSMSYSDRIARQRRVLAEGKLARAGQSTIRPLNPEWDRATLRQLAAGKLDVLDNLTAEEMVDLAGGGANELRTWIASLAALEAAGGYETLHTYYEPVDEWITGMGLMIARPKSP